MSKYLLPTEKALFRVHEGLTKLYALHQQCTKAIETNDEEEHKGALIVSNIMLTHFHTMNKDLNELLGDEDVREQVSEEGN